MNVNNNMSGVYLWYKESDIGKTFKVRNEIDEGVTMD